jgi:hypothetical protein
VGEVPKVFIALRSSLHDKSKIMRSVSKGKVRTKSDRFQSTFPEGMQTLLVSHIKELQSHIMPFIRK